MSNCRAFSKQIKDYIMEELPEDASSRMRDHINACEMCRRSYEYQLDVYKAMLNLSAVNKSTFISSRTEILKKIDRGRYGKKIHKKLEFLVKRNISRIAISSLAAAVLIFFLLHPGLFVNNFLKGVSANWSRNDIMQKSKEEIYKSEIFGISFSIPSSWGEKYKIEERAEGIYVYYKAEDKSLQGSGLLFCIVDRTLVTEGHLDTVGLPRTVEARGVTFVVGGPTGIGFPPEHQEFEEYLKLKNEVISVVKSISIEGNRRVNN